LLQNVVDQLIRTHRGVKNNRRDDAGGDRFEQIPDQGGLAGPYFAGQKDETDVFAESVFQAAQCIFMLRAQLKIIRIGDNLKRFFLESVKFFIHDNNPADRVDSENLCPSTMHSEPIDYSNSRIWSRRLSGGS
jgi:hypothetical protein